MGDQLYHSQLKTGAKEAKEFVRPYGRMGFDTPVAGRSETDLAANDFAADFAAADAAAGADGAYRSPVVLPGDGLGDPGGGGDGDTSSNTRDTESKFSRLALLMVMLLPPSVLFSFRATHSFYS